MHKIAGNQRFKSKIWVIENWLFDITAITQPINDYKPEQKFMQCYFQLLGFFSWKIQECTKHNFKIYNHQSTNINKSFESKWIQIKFMHFFWVFANYENCPNKEEVFNLLKKMLYF